MVEYGHYESVPITRADHTLVSFRTPMPSWPVQRPQRQIRSDCELGHGGYFITVLNLLILTAAQVPAAVHVPAAVQEYLEDDSKNVEYVRG
jgi:hypothetical protein